jgi:uncharacterized protein (DUF2267 family)
MAKLSELIEKIDETAKSGDREKALRMLESVLEKAPQNQALIARKAKYKAELDMQKRLDALEKKFGARA